MNAIDLFINESTFSLSRSHEFLKFSKNSNPMNHGSMLNNQLHRLPRHIVIRAAGNVWLYAVTDESNAGKRETAIRLLQEPDICVSSQVVNEVLANILKKKTKITGDRTIRLGSSV